MENHGHPLEIRGRAVGLHDAGKSSTEIARTLGVPMRTVQHWLKNYADDGYNGLKNKPRQTKPFSISQEMLEDIENFVSDQPFVSSSDIKEHFNLPCHKSTICKRLKSIGYRPRRPARKIDLTEVHQRQRVDFCQREINRDWTAVVFSDEKVFSSSEDSLRLKPVWRMNGTRYLNKNVLRQKRSGRISAAYWGWMTSFGPGEIVRINGRMTGLDYRDILDDIMLPSVRVIYPEPHPIVFVQDNSSVHRSRIVRYWFHDHPEIIQIDWPLKSPDLNPIENIWALMVRRWNNEDRQGNINIRTTEALHANVVRVWEDLGINNVCGALVNEFL